MRKQALLLVLLAAIGNRVWAQDDLLNLLGDEDTGPIYTNASFKTTRVINGHSLENTGHGVLDFRISHRFNDLYDGVSNFYGLDGAQVRLGLDYGVTDRLMVGIGRSSYEKTVDAFVKYKFLRQCDSGCRMPITLAVVGSSSATTAAASKVPWYDASRTDYFTHRLSYSWQLIVGRKFNERVTFQFNPGVVHRNLVKSTLDKNDVFHVSGAGRVKVTKRLAINAEYFYVLRDQSPELFRNCFSTGVDIETGGHVFQLHLTNSRGMFERAFITETSGSWADRHIYFGFNISR
ncbi:MAG TPA: DUF5777 family beta-barrel protein, partial [Flavobacteriales bacterium]|nr:DUF5777 family beta-barrel protein [Flavobacteriales bacterium]